VDLPETKKRLFDLAKSPALANRRDSLLELAASVDSEDAHIWAKVDLFGAFGEDAVVVPRADARDRQIVLLEWARNILVLAPLVITWMGVWLASREYGRLVGSAVGDPVLEAYVQRPFVALWEAGFQLEGFRGGIWFSLSRVALLDMAAIALVIIVSVFIGALRVSREVRLERKFRETWNELREALTWASVHLARKAFDTPAKVAEDLGRATEGLASITDHVIRAEARAEDRHEKIARSIEVFNERLEVHGDVVAGLNASASALRDGMLGFQADFGRTTEEFSTLSSRQSGLVQGLETLVGDFEASVRSSHGQIADLSGGLQRLVLRLEEDGAQVAGLARSLESATSALAQIAEDLRREQERLADSGDSSGQELQENFERMWGRVGQLLDHVEGIGGVLSEIRMVDEEVVRAVERMTMQVEDLPGLLLRLPLSGDESVAPLPALRRKRRFRFRRT